MADPICRWRNSSIKQVCEFNLLFPFHKIEISKGRDIVVKNWAKMDGKDFFTTAYQLAAQMGLYYEDKEFMYPRFNRLISLSEASDYILHWAKKYYAPNPYAKKMTKSKGPVVMNNFLVNWAIKYGEKASYNDALKEMFGEMVGNYDIVANLVNNYMEVKIVDGIVVLKDPDNTHGYQNDEVWLDFDANDKKAFFDFVGKNVDASNLKSEGEPSKIHQQIYYGAPGTGKSNKIKETTEEAEDDDRVFRTTFHPDSDYSTFVGCYKPTMKETIITKDDITTKEEKIVYKFSAQAFTNAYVKAWNTTEDVYLIIEEINRGNCAQIFGDLFQLLDRKDGFSEYPVDADTDLAKYLESELKKSTRTDFPKGVKEGIKLVLPNNLYIWATMNTSDQSLFPIDSAFKRRWEWIYIPIKNHEDINYTIEIGESKYNWWGFLERINEVINSTTSSEDKKLGYFFAKADDTIIKAGQFVGKVLFYLWNDVFKNYGFDNPVFEKEDKKKFAFSDFFLADGKPNVENINKFMERLNEKVEKDTIMIIKKQEAPTGTEA